MARSARPSELSGSWGSAGVRVEIDDAKLSVVVRKGGRAKLTEILDKIADVARSITGKGYNHPYSKTGNLRRSIRAGRIVDVNQWAISGSVEAGGPEAPYAKFVHEGTRAHIIRARPDNPTGVLRFLWVTRSVSTHKLLGPAKGGTRRAVTQHSIHDDEKGWVATHEVHHPGGRPKPFLIVAARRVVGPVDVRRR